MKKLQAVAIKEGQVNKTSPAKPPPKPTNFQKNKKSVPVPEIAKKAPTPMKQPVRNASKDNKNKNASALREPSGSTQINESTKMTIQDASLTTVAKDSKFDHLGVVGQTGASEIVLPQDEGSDYVNDSEGREKEGSQPTSLKNMQLNTQSEKEVTAPSVQTGVLKAGTTTGESNGQLTGNA